MKKLRWLPLVLALCTGQHGTGQSPFPNTVFYQIYTRAFYDSNGDGLGDFNGITEKLDYIEDLGAGALWIMPMFKSNTPHKYFSTDHMLVDPEYGTNDDLKNLVVEAHKRNIKVLIDFSINHVNTDNAWFLDALEQGKNSPYYDYFHWADELEDFNPETYTKDGVFDSAYTKNYIQVPKKSIAGVNFYYARFMDAPDLNFDHPKVRDYFMEVGRYWVGEVGIDGLRLDAARHIYDIESAQATDSTKRNFTWWKHFCEEMHRINPKVFLLGEIWSTTESAASYLQTGMDATFNFSFAETMLNCLLNSKNEGLAEEYLTQTKVRRKNASTFGDATFLINHDSKRLLNTLEHDTKKVRQAVSLLMTFPGSPFIYYGEELGFEADWPLLWLPMLWDEWGKDTGQTSWILGDSTSMNDILTTQYDRKAIAHFRPLAVQKKDHSSWYHFYRSLIQVRKSSKALTSGELRKSMLSSPQVVSFIRKLGKESVLAIHNISSSESIAIPIPKKYRKYKDIMAAVNEASVAPDKFVLPPNASLVLGKN